MPMEWFFTPGHVKKHEYKSISNRTAKTNYPSRTAVGRGHSQSYVRKQALTFVYEIKK